MGGKTKNHSQGEECCNTKWRRSSTTATQFLFPKKSMGKTHGVSTPSGFVLQLCRFGAILCCNDHFHYPIFSNIAVRMQHNATQNCNTKLMHQRRRTDRRYYDVRVRSNVRTYVPTIVQKTEQARRDSSHLRISRRQRFYHGTEFEVPISYMPCDCR